MGRWILEHGSDDGAKAGVRRRSSGRVDVWVMQADNEYTSMSTYRRPVVRQKARSV